MLKNERQYNSARAQLKVWMKNLDVLAARVANKEAEAWLLEEERFGIEQQIKQLAAEVQAYEDIVAGKKHLMPPLLALAELPTLLIQWRLYRHWTQRELAARLGIQENLLQKYEAENFSGVSLQTLQKIAKVLQDGLSEERHPVNR
jgi:DNA-binding Xre family transcriptional regulator